MKPADVQLKRFCRDCQKPQDPATFKRLRFANGRGSFEVCGFCVGRRTKPQPIGRKAA